MYHCGCHDNWPSLVTGYTTNPSCSNMNSISVETKNLLSMVTMATCSHPSNKTLNVLRNLHTKYRLHTTFQSKRMIEVSLWLSWQPSDHSNKRSSLILFENKSVLVCRSVACFKSRSHKGPEEDPLDPGFFAYSSTGGRGQTLPPSILSPWTLSI